MKPILLGKPRKAGTRQGILETPMWPAHLYVGPVQEWSDLEWYPCDNATCNFFRTEEEALRVLLEKEAALDAYNQEQATKYPHLGDLYV